MDSIPTRLLLQPSRFAMAESQRRLAQAQTEAASARHEDVGLALGARTGAAISLRVQLAGLDQSATSLGLASARSETVQDSLSSLGTLAERFRSTLTGARNSENGRALSAALARTSLDAMRDTLSVTHDGQYLFSGLASDTPPLAAYDAGPRLAIASAFQTQFGFAPDDPAAASLTATDIGGFLDGAFAALFTTPGWTSTWSAATDETPKLRLPSGSAVDVSSSANAPFAQLMAQAFSAMEVLGRGKLNATAFTAAADRALALISQAQAKIGDEQARVGIGQSGVKAARAEIDGRRPRLTAAVTALEGVDPYEAATRVNVLMNQLESSYALTSRISRMSLLSYL
ncbi:MAG: flagellar hook-associated family protein [Aestuariivirga sp.]|uniref:flagellar hook-associated family protein n=1 Tax=Aestuariivirga sp. TaxID=2650926 RepID=UPI0025C4F75C|nr:flagellar hook-associated family protein [Aestuariivirga sp.]MCA3561396.1 flagellar hook-associated family protein [Aestuariivirga sp.]